MTEEVKRHTIRGVLVSIVFGPIFLFFTLNAIAALASTFIAGWLPSQWFSDNPVDWIFAFGVANGAANYFTFMISAVLASVSGSVIRWAFTG